MAVNLKGLTIRTAHEALKKGDFSAAELSSAYLDRIEKKNSSINAYIEIYDDVLKQAEEADKRFRDNTATTLTGIPLGLKDNILLKGKRASAASKILENYSASYDATVTEKLKKEGVVFLGRTNMDEFAMGSSTENSAYGVTRNPYDEARVAGGSSGGSAAAVAMDGALAALGTDTGGSVRQPASFCGVVGLKPTYGRVSRYGIIAMGSSLDQVGAIGKTVDDVSILYNAIRGQDSFDSTTIAENTYPVKTKGRARIGVPRDFLKNGGIDKAVGENFETVEKSLIERGYEIEDIDLPNISYSLAAYYIIMPAEVSSNLARYDGMKFGFLKEGETLKDDYFLSRGFGFGRESRRRIILGTYVLSSGYYDAYYNKAGEMRRILGSDFARAFDGIDVILTPTTPSPAFKIGEKTADPVAMYLEDIFTVTANLVGIPALTVPSGSALGNNLPEGGLPLGVQFMGRHGEEETLFNVAGDFLKEKHYG
ncbi:MAG: Asp-tRNA(Asn)/Glu-tRNA(Gln) amidotransferase subunit GatA [bacterium]|nr:Asp-tRNA(Asn)/Glu-tRNA(Gln) amidotransferase subunit GatA [bacterium]